MTLRAQTVVVRDRRWSAWLHRSADTVTSPHTLPGARVVIPLAGWASLTTTCATQSSPRAMLLGSHQECVAACEGPALTVFLDLRSPQAAAFPDEPRILSAKATRRLQAIARAGYSTLARDAEPMLRDVVTEFATSPAPRIDARVEQAVQWLEHHPFAAWSMPALARIVGLSTSRLAHLFQADLGVDARTLALYFRSFGAAISVAHGATLAGAAAHAGFSDQSHFARAARRFFGKTGRYLSDSRNVQDART